VSSDSRRLVEELSDRAIDILFLTLRGLDNRIEKFTLVPDQIHGLGSPLAKSL